MSVAPVADGTGATQLTRNDLSDDDDPVWSPDGKRIAFHSTRDGDEEVFVMNADGTGLTQLTANEGASDGVPVWTAPPGQGLRGTLAFSSNRDGDFEIFVVNADGTGLTQSTENTAHDSGPMWSPTGKEIAFSQ